MRKTISTALLLLMAAVAGVAQEQPAKPADHHYLAVVYYWKAKPGKLDEYSRYIREVAEPIDRDAQKRGAFLSIATFVSTKPDSPWTHMRMFTVADQAHADALKSELDAATSRVVPDEAKRKANSEYAATLRDAAGSEVLEILSPQHAPKCDCTYP